MPVGMIDIRKFPRAFKTDSEERGVFLHEHDDWASPAEVKELLLDAEFYSDKDGPDYCSKGLIQSAKATVRYCKVALGMTTNEKR